MKKCLVMILSFVSFVFLLVGCSDDDTPVQAIRYPLPEHMQIDVRDELPVLIKSEAEFNALFSAYKDEMGWVDFNQYDLVYMQGTSCMFIPIVRQSMAGWRKSVGQ